MNSVRFSPSSFSKGSMPPSAVLARRVVGCMTVGRQQLACTAERMRTWGEVRWLSSSAPRGASDEPEVALEPIEMLMLATRPVRSKASWKVTSPK